MIIQYLYYAAGIVSGLIGMEFIARLTHKYLMHGILWPIHKDHHIPSGRRFQRNNLFALFFAFISMSLFIASFETKDFIYMSFGIGMLFYGILYLIIHDMIIHNYYLHLRNRKHSRYINKLIEVHELHHINDGRGKGMNWGFLLYIPGIDKTRADLERINSKKNLDTLKQ
ncbi:beta-carotene hydroxylase [Picrophilus oshimae]|uniref:Beta carotene hydroxylase n=1 Tax=Picrophilus torridus (strain ATCC 700027 / DSM 9790 / JCM 10055 / NBRC 100828 / KAW 2/3) TaxID=1122961 RepID=Q6KYT6_PICTO|nr:beta-carotene hydroxylase [Picrophilus oshimae]AAT44116.1 beta carotene hydroxylase [Picrophilus oshimae DSM 9789]